MPAAKADLQQGLERARRVRQCPWLVGLNAVPWGVGAEPLKFRPKGASAAVAGKVPAAIAIIKPRSVLFRIRIEIRFPGSRLFACLGF